MNLSPRNLWKIGILAAFFVLLFLLFPPFVAFAEMAAREIRVLWWVILLVALAAWFIWGVGRKPR